MWTTDAGAHIALVLEMAIGKKVIQGVGLNSYALSMSGLARRMFQWSFVNFGRDWT